VCLKTLLRQDCLVNKNIIMRSYLLAGASGGIGLATATLLASQGHKLYIISSQADKLRHLPNTTFLSDGYMQDSWQPENWPDNLDGLVYHPGSIRLKPFRAIKPEEFLADFELNVLGAVRVLQASLKALKNGKQSSVVLYSSVAVAQGMAFHSSIAAAKGAVEALGRSLAAELAPTVRVNVIAPSLTDTPLATKLLSDQEKVNAAAQRHPLKRIGQPQDHAQLCAFLLGEESSWITGQVIGVDGGLSVIR